MLEREWTANLRKELELAGAIIVPIIAGPMSSGWPDRIIWHKLWRGFAEIKGAQTRVTPQQRRNLQSLDRRRPGTAVVLRYPGICEDPLGSVQFEFKSARDLLEQLNALEEVLNHHHRGLKMFLTVRYRCANPLCPAYSWQPLTVRARTTESVTDWMSYVRQQVGQRHAILSDGCCSKFDLAVPLGSEERGTEAKMIGGATPDDDQFDSEAFDKKTQQDP